MNKYDMWKHYCPAEKTEMLIGRGEECSWCGEKEHLKNDGPGKKRRDLLMESDEETTIEYIV